MFKNRKVILIVFIQASLLLSLWTSAHADVPDLMNYSGVLLDASGNPVPDGLYDMRFSLFNGPPGSDEVQVGSTDEHLGVQVTDGRYSVTINVMASDVQNRPVLFLKMEVRNGTGIYEELSPWQEITSSIYAMKAADADTVGGLSSSSLRNATNINAGTLSTSRYDAYSDLSVSGRLDDNAATDLLIRSQSDARYATSSHNHNAANITSGTLSTAYFSAYSDLGSEGYLNNNASNDLLTRGQLDSRYSLISHGHSSLNASDGVPANALSLDVNGDVSISGNSLGVGTNASSSIGTIVGQNNVTGGNDTPGVLGRHATTDYFGVGVKGEGLWRGVWGSVSATGSASYYGVVGSAHTSSTSGTTHGIYGYATGGANAWAGYFAGNVGVTGDIRYSSPQTRYLSIPGNVFNEQYPVDQDEWYNYTYGYGYIGALVSPATSRTVYATAQINLPDGADVRELTCYFLDNDLYHDFYGRVRLYTYWPANGSWQTMYESIWDPVSTYASSSVYAATDTTPLSMPTVLDYQSNAYYLQLYYYVYNTDVDARYPQYVQFNGCRIRYEVSSAGQ